MNREAYELANRIKTEPGTDGDILLESPGDFKMKKYKNNMLQEIKREKQAKKRNFRGVSAAACAALILLAGTVIFSDDVHAMIRQISWSIGNALGISGDLADYREVINTSVEDKGYVITLQEAVASEKKLVINYTLQREDGAAMDEILTADGSLRINGKNVTDGVGGGAEFLDEEQKVVGVVLEYFVENADLSGENDFQISFERIGMTDAVKGNWDFAFKADGSELIADTKRTAIGKTFVVPNGGEITLDEFTSNELEQRIFYSLSDTSGYIFKAEAEDSEGNKAEFGVRIQDTDSGHMQNEEILYDGRLDAEAETVTITLYGVELPKESGQMSHDYVQIGEPFEITLR